MRCLARERGENCAPRPTEHRARGRCIGASPPAGAPRRARVRLSGGRAPVGQPRRARGRAVAGHAAGHLGGRAARRGDRGAHGSWRTAAWIPAEVLASARGGYQLRLPPGVVVDLDEARAALAAAREQLAGGEPARARRRTRSAPARWRGCRSCRSTRASGSTACARSWRRSSTQALELQVRAHAQAGDLHAAADAAERLVRAEPFSEAAHQLRIRVLGEAGDRAGAIAAYEHCRTVLAAELGVAAVGGDRADAAPGARAARRLRSGTDERRGRSGRVLRAGRRGPRLPAAHGGAAAARAGRRHDRRGGGRRGRAGGDRALRARPT